MITSEASPYARTGGLGEVMAALPPELVSLGAQVDVVMPKYKGITEDAYPIRKTDITLELILNDKPMSAQIWVSEPKPGLRILFLQNDKYFDREYLYGTPDADYEDNAERFVFLCRAAIELSVALNIHYDVYHSHDWQASLTPVYLRTLYAGESLLQASAAVMTIHNLGYQGIFWHFDMPLVGVGWEFFTPRHMEFYGKLNFLKSGIIFADEINTVSPGYRDEIITSEYGFGLEGVLQEKGSRLTGIINGVDYTIWNPESDGYIAGRFGPNDLTGKAHCKADLQKIAELPVKPDIPLVSMVSRLSSQKGIDLVSAIVPWIVENGVQLVVLGTGDSRYHEEFLRFSQQYPSNIRAFITYDDQLAHKIFAGSDMLMVPSRYEPCGLTQLYALKYGTIPIVRNTGGLVDTVKNYDADTDQGTGFKFIDAEPDQLLDATRRAVDLYSGKKESWNLLMKRAMEEDFSWTRSAEKYMELYAKAVSDRKEYLDSLGQP
jgi:starch synthase